jgi:selenocysteine lyase/cysteine desulfurase
MTGEQLAEARRRFPVTERLNYLNHASTGPMPREAVAAIAGFAQRAAENGQVPYADAEAMVERARERLAGLLRVAPATLGFTKNTSAGVIIAIGSVEWRPGDNVVLMEDDFPTVTYPFRLMLGAVERRLVTSADLVRDIGAALQLVDGRTRMVALSWVHFLTGRRFDVATLCRECRRRGVTTVIDAIQGIGAVECDWSAVDADFVVSHGAKWLLSPQGTGFIRVRPETLGGLRPFNLGWLSCRWEAFNDIFSEKPLKPGAARFEEGTKNYLGIAGLDASLGLFHEFGPAAVAGRVRALAGRARQGLERLGYDIVTPAEPERSAGMVTATKPGADMAAAFARLERERIAVSLRENMLRVAPHFYNTEDEVDRFLAVLEAGDG